MKTCPPGSLQSPIEADISEGHEGELATASPYNIAVSSFHASCMSVLQAAPESGEYGPCAPGYLLNAANSSSHQCMFA